MLISFEASREDAGRRLDICLTERGGGLSRARIQKAISAGLIRVNGREAQPRTILNTGDRVEGDIRDLAAPNAGPEDIPLHVVYEDEALVVVNKQRGLTVHPGAGRRSGTLVNALAARYGTLPDAGSPERPGIVHRLDKDTSGLMVVALTSDALQKLGEMVAARRFERRYQALVWGSPRWEKARIEAAIGRSPAHPERMAVLAASGPHPSRSAMTDLLVLERYLDTTLVEACLQTGRTHQIRVHCSYAGHDVVGDQVYGGRHALSGVSESERAQFGRLLEALNGQALHAFNLSFEHPLTGEPLSFTADMPDEMMALVEFERLRAGGGG